jgi:hypothetical protein
MDGMLFKPKAWVPASLLVVLIAAGSGCQSAQPVSVRRLISHQAMIDFSGLRSVEQFDVVKAQGAPPMSWKQLAAKRGPLYTDMQWKSPSGATAVGVAHVRMPWPLSARALLWFAKGHYAKESEDGRILGQWVRGLDHLQRLQDDGADRHVRAGAGGAVDGDDGPDAEREACRDVRGIRLTHSPI